MIEIKNRKYVVIINPRSGKGIHGEKTGEIERFLDKNRVKYEIRITKKRGDAELFAKEGVEDGFTHIISVGGDGTSSEIVNAIYGHDIVFSVIPVGSGNDFPRAAGIPVDFNDALHSIVFGKEIPVDIGKFRDRYFINGLGVGLDGAVAKRFKKLKIFGGFPGYLIGAVIEAAKFRGFHAKISSNGRTVENNFILVGASNGSTQGGIRLAPGASVNDNLLDVHMIKDMSFLKRLFTLSKALKAEHLGIEGVSVVQAEDAELTVDKTLPAHMDGETFELERGVYNISIEKDCLKVLVPS